MPTEPNEQQQITTVLTSEDADRRALAAQRAPAIEQAPVDPLAGRKAPPSLADSFRSGILRYTPTAQGLMAAAAVNSIEEVDQADPTWDQFEYYAQHKDEYRDLEQNLRAGHFDTIRSEAGFRRRAMMLRENRELERDIAEGGVPGEVVAMGASLFDITNLLGGGFVTGARAATRLGRVAQGLKIGAVEGAISDVAMRQFDPTSDWKDTVLNIGVGSLAGGTLASFTKNLPPDSPLIPGHPKNPLHPDNLGDETVVIKRPGQTDAEATSYSSAGAAAVDPETAARVKALEDDSLPAKGTGVVGRALQGAVDRFAYVANKVGSWGDGTVFDRMQYYPGQVRQYLSQGLGSFGMLNRAMARGDAPQLEAEAIRNVWNQKGRALQDDLKGYLREAQIALGESKWGARAKGALDDVTNGKVQANRITREEFFGEVVAHMRAKATNNVQAEAQIKARLAAGGRSPDQVQAIYSSVIGAADASTRHMDNMIKTGVEKGMVDPKILEQDYGLPIMFVRGEIMRNRSKFENVIMRLLEKQPQEEWLRESGWVHDGKPATATEAAVPPRTLEDIQKDPATWNQALREWNGELEHDLREQAASAWTDAELRTQRALDEVEAMSEGLDLVTKDKAKKTVASARTMARLAEAKYHGRAVGYALDRAEKAEADLARISAKAEDLLGLNASAKSTVASEGKAIDNAAGRAQQASTDLGEAQGLVDFLRAEKTGRVAEREASREAGTWQGQRDAQVSQEAIERINLQLLGARMERDQAQAALKEARENLRDASRNQRNAARWLEATEREVEKFRQASKESEVGPGFREQLEIDRQRIDDLQAAVAKAEGARKEAIDVWKQTRKGLGIGRRELAAAQRQFRKTGRLVEKLGKRTPKAQYAEDLARSLSGLDHYPGGMLMDEAPEIGRLKERRFKWTEELLAEAQAEGLVESDLSYMMDRYTRDMGGRLALHDAYGGQSYATLTKNVDETMRKWTEEAPVGSKERESRTQAHAQALKDWKYVWDRNAGRHQVEPTDTASFLMKTLMNGAYIRIAGGIAKAAVQDVATAVFSNPRFVKQMLTAGRAYSKLLKELEEAMASGDPAGRAEGLRQLKVLLQSMENAGHTGISQRAIGRGSALEDFGVGNGITRSMTRNLEVGMQNLGDKITWATGLNAISDFVRHNAAFAHIADMAEFSKKPWESLSRAQKARLASLNIGQAEHQRIGELMRKHGKKHGALFDPGIDQWDDPRIVEIFESSVVKAQNRAAYTESIGATPISLHEGNIYQKALGQFQSHAYMTLRFFIQGAVQRGAVTGDYYSGMAALALSTSLGTLMTMARQWESGQLDKKLDEWEKNPSTLVREMVDRSGMLGAMSPMFDAGTKAFGGKLNDMLGTKFFGTGTKFSQNSAFGSVLGPAYFEGQTIFQILSNTVNGEFDKAGQKLLRLVPFNQQIRGLMEAHNAMNSNR